MQIEIPMVPDKSSRERDYGRKHKDLTKDTKLAHQIKH